MIDARSDYIAEILKSFMERCIQLYHHYQLLTPLRVRCHEPRFACDLDEAYSDRVY